MLQFLPKNIKSYILNRYNSGIKNRERCSMVSNKTLIGSIAWKLGERSIVQVISLVTQIILARMIAPEEFGSLSVIIIFYNMTDLIVQKGFGSALIRKEKLSHENVNAVFCISLIMAVVLYAGMFFAAPMVGRFYKDSSLVNPLRFLMLNLIMSPIYCICNSLLIRNMQFKAIFVRGLCASLISGIAGIILAYAGFGLWALVSQMVINQFVLTVVMYVALKSKIALKFSKEAFNEVFSFGRNVLITEFLLTFIESLRSLLIGKVYTKSDLAYYDRGQVYPATLMRVMYDTLYSTLLPFLSKEQNDKTKLAQSYVTITHVTVAVITPIFFGMAVTAPEIINILLTDKWAFAIKYMQIFCIYQAIFSYQMTSKTTLYALGNSKSVMHIELIKSFVSITLMIISMCFGVIYVALSLIVVRTVSNLLYLIALRKKLGHTTVIKETIAPIISACVMMIAAYPIRLSSLAASLALKIIVGITVYILMLVIFDRKMMRLAAGKLKKFRG